MRARRPLIAGEALAALALARGESAAAFALPRECYVDPGFFELELERVLRPGWHAVAHASQLPATGDYRSVDLFGSPVLVTRDESGRLRAFSRVCLHRAMPIVEGSGNAKRFSCPYHRWSYDLSGQLRAAPCMEDVPGFDRDRERLPELRLEEWQGFVFATLDADAKPLGASLAPLAALLDEVSFGTQVLAATLEFESRWNWKVMVENFIESYHHQGAHLQTLQPTNPAAGTFALDLDAPVAVIENPAVPGAQPFWAGVVFPTFLFVAFRGPVPVGVWYEMTDLSPARFVLRIHVLLPPALASKPDFVAGVVAAAERIHREDIPMCEGVQTGLRSSLWRPGRLAPQERALATFHRLLASRIASGD